MARSTRRWPRWLGIASLVLLVLAGVLFFLADESRPVGEPGPQADALARRIEQTVNLAAWARTGAVRWRFGDRNTHLWDRTRRLHSVQWDDIEVLRSFDTGRGRAFEGGQEVKGERLDELLDSAYARWANDSFWLNPLAKLFDDGVTRGLVELGDGSTGLLVSYSSGGVTPGDAYLWVLGDDGLPAYWKMWVSILPTGGVKSTWEAWQTLPTGARVSTLHRTVGTTLEVSPVEAAATLRELETGGDPFARLQPR